MSSQDMISFGFLSRLARPLTLVAVTSFALAQAFSQYPGQVTKQDKDAPELRAVAVVEYTGDAGHPKASRLVPVSVFDGQQLQDGGIYLARPQPLALDSQIEYQLQQDGRAVGYFVVQGAAEEQGSWVGQGVWKPLIVPPSPVQLARARAKIKIDADDDATDGPVLHRKHRDDGPGSDASSGPPPDPDRPTLHRAPSATSGDSTTTASSGTGNGGSGSSAPDSNLPTLHRSPNSDSTGSDDASNNSSPDDPDRPHLHKKTDQEPKSPNQDVASVDSMPDITDPDRPRLRRGKPTGEGLTIAPTVMGLPPDMHQEVGVSDPKNTPDHPWNFSWANLDDESKMKTDMEDKARAALGLNPPPSPAPKHAPSKVATRASTTKKAAPSTPPAPKPLLDEQFRVFELAYGSGATMVLSAHTDGTGAQEKFVTLIAQPDLYGSVVVLLKSVTDAAHLDQTPRMRLVDAVDAMADNRGELLFELRGATQRQFALYRVLRGSAEKLFVTGGTYFGAPSGE